LQKVSLTVNAGDFISIEGSSGIGKSTLLYVMGGLLKPDAGSLYLANQDISQLNDRQLTTLRAEKIGFIFQEANLIQALTVQENIEFAQSLGKRGKTDLKKLMLLMERLGLTDRKDFMPYQLSGGQRRRAMIARALINYPDLILADEPTNDLEDGWVEEIFQLFKEARQESCAVVMVTHHHRWAAEAAVQYKLEQGKLTLLDN